jgi:hypothetical protein
MGLGDGSAAEAAPQTTLKDEPAPVRKEPPPQRPVGIAGSSGSSFVSYDDDNDDNDYYHHHRNHDNHEHDDNDGGEGYSSSDSEDALISSSSGGSDIRRGSGLSRQGYGGGGSLEKMEQYIHLFRQAQMTKDSSDRHELDRRRRDSERRADAVTSRIKAKERAEQAALSSRRERDQLAIIHAVEDAGNVLEHSERIYVVSITTAAAQC